MNDLKALIKIMPYLLMKMMIIFQSHMRLNLLKELLMTLILALLLISPLCVMVKLVRTEHNVLEIGKNKEKKIATTAKISKKVTRGDEAFDNALTCNTSNACNTCNTYNTYKKSH